MFKWQFVHDHYSTKNLQKIVSDIFKWQFVHDHYSTKNLQKIVSEIFKWQFVHDHYSTKNLYTCTEQCTLIHKYIEVCIVVKMRVTLDILFTASSIA